MWRDAVHGAASTIGRSPRSVAAIRPARQSPGGQRGGPEPPLPRGGLQPAAVGGQLGGGGVLPPVFVGGGGVPEIAGRLREDELAAIPRLSEDTALAARLGETTSYGLNAAGIARYLAKRKAG